VLDELQALVQDHRLRDEESVKSIQETFGHPLIVNVLAVFDLRPENIKTKIELTVDQ
jgi:hypothetical protein